MKAFCLSCVLIICCSFPSMGSAQYDNPKAKVATLYSMSIDSIASEIIGPSGAPVTPVENRTRMKVEITLEVKSSIPGVQVPVVPAWICVADRAGECNQRRDTVQGIAQLGAGIKKYHVTVAAPEAGKSASLRLNLCQGNQGGQKGAPCSKLLTYAESGHFPVAASFSLHLKDVEIDQIRSPHNDTVFSTIAGDPHMNDSSCSERCTQAFLSSNSPNRTHITTGLYGVSGGRQIGPFIRVPQDGDIWISYVLLNLGAKYDDDSGKNLVRWKALQAHALNLVKAGLTFRNQGDYPSAELNSANYRWAGCDGPLIGRVFILPNTGTENTIFTWTENTGQNDLPTKDNSPKFRISDDDCHQPDYHVTWSLVRDSWYD